MNETTLAILGAAGRMGRMLVAEAAKTSGVKIAAAAEAPGNAFIGQDAGLVAGIGPVGVPITTTDAAAADVFIDFTFHAAVPGNLAAAARNGACGYVLATTGLLPEEEEAVAGAAASLPIVKAANMSLGVNLILDLVRRAAALLDPSYDIEIVEMHHRHKKDAPSGTALTLARAAAEGRGLDLDAVARFGREGVTGERPPDEIAIHALRGGDVVGDHDVTFAADGELVRLSHRATSRSCLSRGALRAARWLAAQPAGVHTIAESLGL